jgi:hypothetical protein
MPLPYPGFSWSLTQHADKINAKDVYALLAAAEFSRTKQQPNVAANRFLAELAEQGVVTLTPNVRSAVAQPWRDYQQILPELGLMFSTEIVRQPQLTQMGMMYLDGNIGFDEVVTTQVLRYQYPNGLKTDVQGRMAQCLYREGWAVPESRLDLDSGAGILIRPAVLMGRVLLEIQRRSPVRVALTLDQTASVLMNVKRNSDWRTAIADLGNAERVTDHRRRNAQDWFKLLGKSLIFARTNDTLSLSDYSIENREYVESVIQRLEDERTFWIPAARRSLTELRLDWFRAFGNGDMSVVWSPPEDTLAAGYINENYLGGLPPDDDVEEGLGISGIRLQDFAGFQGRSSRSGEDAEVDVARILAGRRRQEGSSILHDAIVRQLGQRLNELEYRVQFDPSSVDVFAQKDGFSGILEVKTVGPRNTAARLRLGTGQLIEYRRRYEVQSNQKPSCVLVLGVPSLPPALRYWGDVLDNGADMGLIGYGEGRFVAQTGGAFERLIAGVQ